MNTSLITMISFLMMADIAMAQSYPPPSSYEIETVEVAPKGTKADQSLDEELGSQFNGSNSSSETNIAPLSQRSTYRDAFDVYGYESALEMRSRRRVGVGFATSGQMGLIGAMVDLNLTAENSLVLGFGGGPKYHAFSTQWKHVFGGQVLSAYSSLGYARWYNASGQNGGVSSTNPSYLANKFMSDDEKRTGQFSINLLTPSLGVQYNQLVGQYTGTSVFLEIMMLTSLDTFKQAPTGSLGMLYYF